MRDPKAMIWFVTSQAFKEMPFRMTLCVLCAIVMFIAGLIALPCAMYLDRCANEALDKRRLRIVR